MDDKTLALLNEISATMKRTNRMLTLKRKLDIAIYEIVAENKMKDIARIEGFSEQTISFLKQCKWINAIKQIREETNCGLKEALEKVNSYRQSNGLM